MKRRLFLAGIFSTPVAALASSPNLNNILGEDKEITLSIDYDYTGYNKMGYLDMQNEIWKPIIKEINIQVKEKGVVIDETTSQSSIDNEISNHLKINFYMTIENAYNYYSPRPNAKGTLNIVLTPALKRTNIKVS